MAIKGYIDANIKILADDMNAPHILDEGGVTDAVSENIADIIEDRAEEIFDEDEHPETVAAIQAIAGGGGSGSYTTIVKTVLEEDIESDTYTAIEFDTPININEFRMYTGMATDSAASASNVTMTLRFVTASNQVISFPLTNMGGGTQTSTAFGIAAITKIADVVYTGYNARTSGSTFYPMAGVVTPITSLITIDKIKKIYLIKPSNNRFKKGSVILMAIK